MKLDTQTYELLIQDYISRWHMLLRLAGEHFNVYMAVDFHKDFAKELVDDYDLSKVEAFDLMDDARETMRKGVRK